MFQYAKPICIFIEPGLMKYSCFCAFSCFHSSSITFLSEAHLRNTEHEAEIHPEWDTSPSYTPYTHSLISRGILKSFIHLPACLWKEIHMDTERTCKSSQWTRDLEAVRHQHAPSTKSCNLLFSRGNFIIFITRFEWVKYSQKYDF